MNDKQIAAFICVAESGSFSAAARKNYISPQAMLQQIDLLEKEIGVKLLTRNSKGIKLTDAGQKFYEGSLYLSQKMNALLDDLRSAPSAEQNSLRLGLYLTRAMNQVCEGFAQKYPDVSLEYSLLSNEAGLDNFKLLSSNLLDILEQAEVPEVYQSGFEYTPLFKSRCLCALSPSHPLAHLETIRPSDLAGLPIGIHAESCIPGLKSLLQSEAPGFTLINRTQGVPSAFDHCVGNGVFIISESFAEKFRPLRIIPLECDLHWTFGLLCRRNPDPVVRQFINYAKENLSAQA